MPDRRLRIGIDGRILALPQTRGLTRYAANLLRAMSARDDVSLNLICREPPYAPHLEGVRAEVTCARPSRELHWLSVVLPQAIRAAEVDVFHALADRGLPFRPGVPAVVTVHGSYERSAWRSCYPTRKDRAWYWANEIANWALADRVVTVSRTTASQLLELGVARPGRVRVVLPAAAPEFTPEPDPSDTAVVQKYGVTGPYLLFVGGYDPNKNVDVVVDAFLKLRTEGLTLVIAADYQYRYQRLCSEWLTRDGAHGLLLVEVCARDLPALYRLAKAGIVASFSESFSFPAVETMACGTPLIASYGTAVTEIAGNAPRYFDPRDADDLAHGIEEVLGDRSLRQQMAARGLVSARELSWEKAAADTVAVYREIAD